MTDEIILPDNYDNIRAGIVELLKAARSTAARNVNSIMTATYWEIGRRIVESEQGGAARASYGDELIKQLATDLSTQFGRGFGVVNLSQMKRFFLTWPAKGIFQTPSEKSSKSHLYSTKYASTYPVPPSLPTSSRYLGLPMSGCFPSRTRRRGASMKPKLCDQAGPCVSLTAKSTASSMNALRSRKTKPPCWKSQKPPSPVI